MKLKTFFSIIGIQCFLGFIFYKTFPEYVGEASVVIIICLLMLAWYFEVIDRRKTVEKTLEKTSRVNEPSDKEYDNDFSKVPAGTSNGTIIPPRSIGFGHGVGDKTMFEDLERIGIKDIDENKDKK